MTMRSALRTKNRIAMQKACPAVLEDMLRHLQSVYRSVNHYFMKRVVKHLIIFLFIMLRYEKLTRIKWILCEYLYMFVI